MRRLKKVEVRILNPEKELFSGEAASLSADAVDGRIGILPHHAPLITVLKKGRIEISTPDGSIREIEINQGLLKTGSNRVTALII